MKQQKVTAKEESFVKVCGNFSMLMIMSILTYLIEISWSVVPDICFGSFVRLLHRKDRLKTKSIRMHLFMIKLSHFDFQFDELFSNDIGHQHFLRHLSFLFIFFFFIYRHRHEVIFVSVDFFFRGRIVGRFEFFVLKNKRTIKLCSFICWIAIVKSLTICSNFFIHIIDCWSAAWPLPFQAFFVLFYHLKPLFGDKRYKIYLKWRQKRKRIRNDFDTLTIWPSEWMFDKWCWVLWIVNHLGWIYIRNNDHVLLICAASLFLSDLIWS